MTEHSGKSEDENGAPEVEAELVVDDSNTTAEAFDDPSEDVDEALADVEADPASKKSTLTPGVVLFFAFTALALIAFAVWWFQTRGEKPAAPASPAAESEPQDTAVAEQANSTPSAPNTQDEPATISLPEPSAKIDNPPIGALRPPSGEESATSPSDDSFLPPVSGAGAEKTTNNIAAGAEAIRRRMEETESAAELSETELAETELAETEVPEDPPTDEITGFDIAPADGDAPPQDPSTLEEFAEIRAEDVTVNAAAPDAEARPGASPLPAKIANDITILRNQTAALEGALSAERERNAQLAAEIADLRQSVEAAFVERDARYGEELSAMRAGLEKIQNNEVKGATDQLRANLALNALRQQIEAGEPFADELTAVAAFAPEEAPKLAASANAGVPTVTELRESFAAAARAGLAAAGQEKAGGGVSGLLARAQSLVSIRPAAPQAGDSPRAVVSRAEDALDAGDLTYALSELDTLPESARAAMNDWVVHARARRDAEDVLKNMATQFYGDGSE